MKSWTSFFRPYDVLLLAGAGLLMALYAAAAGAGFALDDSWIHQVFARNLAETGQWAFIPGQPTAASTSPLYTLLLAIGYLIGMDYRLWALLLGALALAGCAVVGARMAERLQPQLPYAGLLAGLALLLNWHLIWAGASGMETMLFSMFTLVLIALAWRELDAAPHAGPAVLRGLVFGAAAALTTLSRPEGVGLAGLAGLALLLARPQGLRPLLWWSGGAAAGFFVLLTPYLLLNFQLTGGLLPDTAAAKQAQHAVMLATPYPQRLFSLLLPLLPGALVLLLPGLFYTLWDKRRAGRSLFLYALLLLWPLALLMLYAARLPASYQHGRYVIPALPALFVAGAVGLLALVVRGRGQMLSRVLTRSLLFAAVGLLLVFALGIGPDVFRTDVAIINEEMVAMALWIGENIPQDELLAIHDIGAVGFFAPREELLDIAGLVTPEVIPLLWNPEGLWALMEGRGARYLVAFPDQIPGRDINDPRLCLLHTTNAPTARQAGGENMSIYSLSWQGNCVTDEDS